MEKGGNEMGIDHDKIKKAVHMILEAIGEDATREGLMDTPDRVARMYTEIFSGLSEDPAEHFSVVFNENHQELVIVKDIPFFSVCEHHLIPFYGKAHVGYIPNGGRIAGLSKFARLVEGVSKRPQLQERITSTIANVMMDQLQPQGVIVIIEAEHMCMTMRGIRKPGSKTVTSAVRGIFKEETNSRLEALNLIGVR